MHIAISREIEKLIKQMQRGIISQISKSMPVNEEILTQICHEIKRMRDVLINILPVGNQEDHPQKVGLLCEMYVKICEKQKVLDTLVE